jgi:hypothetical protein
MLRLCEIDREIDHLPPDFNGQEVERMRLEVPQSKICGQEIKGTRRFFSEPYAE